MDQNLEQKQPREGKDTESNNNLTSQSTKKGFWAKLKEINNRPETQIARILIGVGSVVYGIIKLDEYENKSITEPGSDKKT